MDQDYCLQQIKSYDYERYIAVLMAPKAQQSALAALYAFRIELDRVQTLVKEPMMGLIRFEWWREAIAKMFAGDVLRHHVIEALSLHLSQWKESDFHQLIDAYQTDFETKEFSTKEQLWNHTVKLVEPFLKLQTNEKELNALAKCVGMKHILTALQTKSHFMGYNSGDPLLLSLVKEVTQEMMVILDSIDAKIFKNTPMMAEYLIAYRFGRRLQKADYSVDLLGRQPDWLFSWYLFRKQWL
jgi:Squalene/phytoene synthase